MTEKINPCMSYRSGSIVAVDARDGAPATLSFGRVRCRRWRSPSLLPRPVQGRASSSRTNLRARNHKSENGCFSSFGAHVEGIRSASQVVPFRSCLALYTGSRGPLRSGLVSPVGRTFVDKTPGGLVLIRSNGEVHPTDDDCRIEGQSWARHQRRAHRIGGARWHWKADREGLHDRDIASSAAQGSITCLVVGVGKN